jgi:SAM-dependent methyltransferase
VRCVTCGLVRTDPRPSRLDFYYPSDYYSFQSPLEPTERRIRIARRVAARRVNGGPSGLRAAVEERAVPGLPPRKPGEILDVGCGSGETLLLLRQLGWRCRGIEIDGEAVRQAVRAGLRDVVQGDLVELELAPNSADVVRFWHSLEHVVSPRAQLGAARTVLRDDGWLVVGVPNVKSLLTRVFRDRSFYVDAPRHLWHFDRSTLSAMAEEAGFHIHSLRLVSDAEPFLGTLRSVLPFVGAMSSRRAWRAALPIAVGLDALGLGDALELVARPRTRNSAEERAPDRAGQRAPL